MTQPNSASAAPPTDETAASSSLFDLRQTQADAVYADYDFNGLDAEAAGWDVEQPGDRWVRKVFLETDEGDDEMGQHITATLAVTFKPASAIIERADAHDCAGNTIGEPSLPFPQA